MQHDDFDLWLWRPRPRANARFRLFCFPFAGSGPRVYQGWDDWLEPELELFGVRLPGRENRLREAAYSDWETLLEETAAVLEPWLDRPFALFGHSFGAQIAFQLAARWCDRPERRLRLVGVSACAPPHRSSSRPGLSRLDRKHFFERLARGGGVPVEALANEEFKRLFEPTLRADIALAEAWQDLPRARVTVPVAAFAGTQDIMAPPEAMREWAHYAEGGFSFAEFDGGHFFLRDQPDRLVEAIGSLLRASPVPL